jgi:hypothetical protein
VLQGEDALAFRRLARGGFAAVPLGALLLYGDAALTLLFGKTRARFADLLPSGLLATVVIAKLGVTTVLKTMRLFATRIGLLFASAALRGFHRIAAAIAAAVDIATLVFAAGQLALPNYATLLVFAPCLFAAFAIATTLAFASGFAHTVLLRALFGRALQGCLTLLRRTRLRRFAPVVVHACPIDLRTLLLLAHGVARLCVLAFAHLHRAGVRARRREALVATLWCGALRLLACLSRLGAAFVLLLLIGLAVVLTGERRARHAEGHHHGHCAAQDVCARQQPFHRLHYFPPAGATQLSLWAVSDRGA